MSAPDWLDEAVEAVEQPPLNLAQIQRLMNLTKAMREDPALMAQVAVIKELLGSGDIEQAISHWDELEDWEQQVVWVAPKFGGVFTTEQRTQLRNKE